MARNPDSPEVKAAKAQATKIVARLVKDGFVSEANSKEAKTSVTAVLAKAATAVAA